MEVKPKKLILILFFYKPDVDNPENLKGLPQIPLIILLSRNAQRKKSHQKIINYFTPKFLLG